MADVEELKAKRLCHRCVGESYLSAEIRQQGLVRQCSFCGRSAKSYSIGAMANRIEEVFEEHFVRTSDQPDSSQEMLLSDRESEYDWERDGEPVVQSIAGAADIPQGAAENIQAILDDKHRDFDADAMGEETAFSSESCYEESPTTDRVWQTEWRRFERALKTEARFFSRKASAHLASIFDGIDRMSAPNGRPLVIEAGPRSALNAVYRARVFQSDELLEAALCRPDQQLGSPPPHLSAAGRMNAKGISVFYGANEPRVAIAEVRPPVGSQVAVARFLIIRPLRLLDLTAVGEVRERGSIFDPDLSNRLERAMFLRSLSQRMTLPVMPDDEAFEYLPTQAIADFLATDERLSIDGILFPSVQAAGEVLNVVLFQKASLVEPIEMPEGLTISASTGQFNEDGWEIDYSVFERLPSETSSINAEDDLSRPSFGRLGGRSGSAFARERREAALRVDLSSVKVHRIERVEVRSSEYSVLRHRR